jgi:hypothetical protein
MTKWFVSIFSALLGVSLSGLMPVPGSWDDDPEPAPNAKARVKALVKVQEGPGPTKAEAGDADPAESLRQAYVVLRRLRSEPGSASKGERPRVWTEQAVRLYRDGVSAYENGNAAQAGAYAAAAKELARAVELARDAVRTEQADPDDLPPPPPTRLYQYIQRKARVSADTPGLPPPLPADDDADPDQPRPPRPPRPGMAPRAPRAPMAPGAGMPPMAPVAPIAPGGPPMGGGMMRGAGAGMGFGGGFGGGFGAQSPPNAEQRIRRLEQELDRLQEQLRDAEKTGKTSAHPPVELRVVTRELQGIQSSAKARGDLQRAFERIRDARAQNPGPEARLYLDAARDLYNAARRDAETGRDDRASELARAAEALTLVPKHLSELGGEPGARLFFREIEKTQRRPGGPAAGKDQQKKIEIIIKKRKADGDDGDDDASPKPGAAPRARQRFEIRKAEPGGTDGEKKTEIIIKKRKADGDNDDEDDAPKPGAAPRVRERLEIRKVAPREGPGGQSSREDGDDAGTQGGIGIAIQIQDGEAVVREILPDGPAARDGRLKEGDRMVGVEDEEGVLTEFDGNDPANLARVIRGPRGSKVRIVVVPKGSSDRKVYDLTRDVITLRQAAKPPGPDDEESEPEADKGSAATNDDQGNRGDRPPQPPRPPEPPRPDDPALPPPLTF